MLDQYIWKSVAAFSTCHVSKEYPVNLDEVPFHIHLVLRIGLIWAFGSVEGQPYCLAVPCRRRIMFDWPCGSPCVTDIF